MYVLWLNSGSGHPSLHFSTSFSLSRWIDTPDSNWRNRDEIFQGREVSSGPGIFTFQECEDCAISDACLCTSYAHKAIRAFLRKKWAKEHDYCLMKELWGFHGNRISARFEYEWHDGQGQWWRSHGNEQWEYDAKGTLQSCTTTHKALLEACIRQEKCVSVECRMIDLELAIKFARGTSIPLWYCPFPSRNRLNEATRCQHK